MTSNKLDLSELAAMVNINSYTKNKQGVDQVAALYGQYLAELGFSDKVYKRQQIGDHHLYKSHHSVGRKVLLLGHFDTVFPPNTFENFSEDEHWIYGPGVCDMKGGNFVALSALREIKALHGAIVNIDVLMVSDEESGSDDSKLITAKIAKDYDLCLVFEAAGPESDIVVARKGIATYEFCLTGKAAHAGNHYSEGIDANLAAAHMVIALAGLTRLNRGTTVNAGKLVGGIGANTISPSATIKVEARFNDTEEKTRVLDAIEDIANYPKIKGVKVELSGGLQRDVMQTSNEQVLLIESLENIVGHPFKLEQRGGVSDANVVAGVGVPTLDGFGPYGDGDHTINERANKASLLERVELVTKILLAYNGSSTAMFNDEHVA